MQKETFYGNYAEYKEPQVSKRSEGVVLSAIEKCESLENELNNACVRIGELTRELDEAKKYIEFLRENKNEVSKCNGSNGTRV
jgi:hypothetical protein